MAQTMESGPELARQAGVNPVDYLRQRGYVYDVTDEEGLRQAFAAGPVTLYVGYDATARSLHIGNLVSIMMMANLQRLGHRPIALAGGGTSMIGDPSGKTNERQMMTLETIEDNLSSIRKQFARYIDFDGGQFGGNPAALLLNNADWLLQLKVIPFLRDVGKHFSVNEMLAAETYRVRLETTGLSFIEFNYRVLQSFDYLHLFRSFECVLQMGGSDQWGNITAGADLIRRADGGKAYGLVCPLITRSDGQKMGKSESGAVWLSEALTSPFDFYQYWINSTDEDVARFMRLFTFMPEERIVETTSVSGEALREAKAVLAWEVTSVTHGVQAADEAAAASRALFSGSGEVDIAAMATDIEVVDSTTWADLFIAAGLATSRNDARRLARQGGMSINDQRLEDADRPVGADEDLVVLRAGKKRYRTVRLVRGESPS
jgi:tyrosyl-tRNA synthetase